MDMIRADMRAVGVKGEDAEINRVKLELPNMRESGRPKRRFTNVVRMDTRAVGVRKESADNMRYGGVGAT